MKKILSVFLVFSFLFIASHNPVSAAEEHSTEVSTLNEVSKDFTKFIDDAFYNLSSLTVLDSAESDVTDEFVTTVTPYFNSNDYKSIQDVIVEQNLSVSIQKIEDTKLPIKHNFLNENSELDFEMASIRSQNVSEYFYHLENATTGGLQKEWFTNLTGSFSYDDSTYKVTYVYGPVVSFTHNFGAGFSASMTNVTTSNSKSGWYANYSATYTMTGSAGFSIGDLPIGFTFNFGRHTDKFTEIPSGLQSY